MAEPNYTLKLTLSEASYIREAIQEKHDRDAARRPEGTQETAEEIARRHQSVIRSESLLRRL